MNSHGVSEAFRELAGVLELFESDETDIDLTFATPTGENVLEDESVSVEVGVLVPFLDSATEATVTPRDVYYDDGDLLVDLEVSMRQNPEGNRAISTDTTDSIPVGTPSPGRGTAARKKNGGDEQTNGESPETSGLAGDSGAEQTTTESESTDETSRSDGRDGRDESASDETETETVPPYKDPERLQTVYEENDTFSEMTAALDVDVTPQTVRRYMIKHDIHEPASTTGSQSAELLLNTDPESIFDRTTSGEDEKGEPS